MESRRDFLKKAAMLAGTVGVAGALPNSVLKAMAINPAKGSSFYDAEHVVFLMQENRSFDHFFGTMKGVRGFNDPHPHIQPNGNKVWVQNDRSGKSYVPFHVDINKTKVTWQGGLPHTWDDQVAARNDGKYNKWIPVKTPMSLAYYQRDDIPFYYALADAFTVCDQHFCSSLTGTTPNRLFFFTGTIRGEGSENEIAVVDNHQAESRNNVFVDWPTFQEELEDKGVDWRIYQNELWTSNLGDELDDWLGNYGDNPLEYVKRHNVRLSAYFRKNGDNTVKPALSPEEVREQYNKLSQREKNLIDKAFTTNIESEHYLELEPYTFNNDQGKPETINIPRGDIFYQFRKDVNEGKLPAVSWIVAPKKFSDHTSSPLYGTWYVSEALNILTKNPEIWKKTIFILTYDENDGYFDHQPPFVVPDPRNPDSGKVSEGIHYSVDFESVKGSPIGLGYRVPMIIASPWSKGGFVNSQVFDHTSSIIFLEKWLTKKTGKNIRCKNISEWRRTICGDLTSAFRKYDGEAILSPVALQKEAVIAKITNARNKPPQTGPTALTDDEISRVNMFESFSSKQSVLMPRQEYGVKPACPLPYNLNVDANFMEDELEIVFEAGKQIAGHSADSAGAAFIMNSLLIYKELKGKIWSYTVKPEGVLKDKLQLNDFAQKKYDLVIYGPNGFFRRFSGGEKNPKVGIRAFAEKKAFVFKRSGGRLVFTLENNGRESVTVLFKDNKSKAQVRSVLLEQKSKTDISFEVKHYGNWYDLTVYIQGNDTFMQRYVGKIETGEITITDPFMGGMYST